MAALSIIAYSDYVCPWCYIGLARIERLQREYDVRVTWRPFELHPETPRSGALLAGRLGSQRRARAYAENIIGLAQASGLRMRMPALIANSHRALEVAEHARERGGFDAMHAALFRAYFEESRDIGDADEICDIGRACGVDDQGLRQALADETHAVAVDTCTAEARASGIVSTPAFVFDGGFTLVGAQDYDVFASITERLMRKQRPGDAHDQRQNG
jgi:predicted DsbA family dithiol-disulfide isomerase